MTTQNPIRSNYPSAVKSPDFEWFGSLVRALVARDRQVNNALLRNELLSDTFAIDSTGIKTITIDHQLNTTPPLEHCQISVAQNTAVTDWGFDLLMVSAVSSTQVTVKIHVSTASATGGATAKIILWVRP